MALEEKIDYIPDSGGEHRQISQKFLSGLVSKIEVAITDPDDSDLEDLEVGVHAFDLSDGHRQLSVGALASLIKHAETGRNDSGDLGGEYADLPPFLPSGLGGTALQPPNSEPILATV